MNARRKIIKTIVKTIPVLLTVVIVLCLVGCGSEEESLLGKWTTTIEGITISREFKSDGTIIERVNNGPFRSEGTYIADDKRITISMTTVFFEESGNTLPIDADWDYSYSIKGNILMLLDLNFTEYGALIYTRD